MQREFLEFEKEIELGNEHNLKPGQARGELKRRGFRTQDMMQCAKNLLFIFISVFVPRF